MSNDENTLTQRDQINEAPGSRCTLSWSGKELKTMQNMSWTSRCLRTLPYLAFSPTGPLALGALTLPSLGHRRRTGRWGEWEGQREQARHLLCSDLHLFQLCRSTTRPDGSESLAASSSWKPRKEAGGWWAMQVSDTVYLAVHLVWDGQGDRLWAVL